MIAKKRYEGLDHLRGLLAMVVMFYHFSLWLNYDESLPKLIERPLSLLGLYAVSAFYCLSGVALYVVYRERNVSKQFIVEFFIKRGFRICPLFWVVTTATIIVTGVSVFVEDGYRVFLSYSLLFSWLDPTAYFAVGAWSIGNEWAFYTLFPVLLILWQRLWSRVIAILATIVISCYYAFYLIRPDASVAEQWSLYIEPLNQVILFVGGMVIGWALVNRPTIKYSSLITITGSVAFLAISYLFEKQYCIHGFLRLALVGVCFLWCYGAGLSNRLVGKSGGILDWLGGLSYSVYLLHPIFFGLVSRILKKLFGMLPDFSDKVMVLGIIIFVVGVVATLVASHYSYKILEKPAMRLGKKFAERFSR